MTTPKTPHEFAEWAQLMSAQSCDNIRAEMAARTVWDEVAAYAKLLANRYDPLPTEVEQLRAEVESLKAKLAEAEREAMTPHTWSEADKMLKERDQAIRERDTVMKSLDEVLEGVESLRTEVKRLTGQVVELTRERDDALAELERLRSPESTDGMPTKWVNIYADYAASYDDEVAAKRFAKPDATHIAVPYVPQARIDAAVRQTLEAAAKRAVAWWEDEDEPTSYALHRAILGTEKPEGDEKP